MHASFALFFYLVYARCFCPLLLPLCMHASFALFFCLAYARCFCPPLLPRVCTLLLPSSFASCMHARATGPHQEPVLRRLRPPRKRRLQVATGTRRRRGALRISCAVRRRREAPIPRRPASPAWSRITPRRHAGATVTTAVTGAPWLREPCSLRTPGPDSLHSEGAGSVQSQRWTAYCDAAGLEYTTLTPFPPFHPVHLRCPLPVSGSMSVLVPRRPRGGLA